MSNEIDKSNNSLTQGATTIGKAKIGQSMIAGALASLITLELPRMFNQLVIFLLDGSGSMTFNGASGKTKGHELHQAVIKVLERLRESKHRTSFDAAFWAFANESIEMFPLKAVKEYDLVKDCFNPCEFTTDKSRTVLLETLNSAKEMALGYLKQYDGQPTKVLIITLGDGAIHDYNTLDGVKEELLSNDSIVLSSILFESPDWGENVDHNIIKRLQLEFSELASNEADYLSSVDVEKIRGHMIQSITKISKI